MPTCDRPDMTERAIRCWRAQTYENKHLVVLYSSIGAKRPKDRAGIAYAMLPATGLPLGRLRNLANEMARGDILIHWDSDDWSHPLRIEEQVALLKSSGADAVGYNQMLFWNQNSEAWLYTAQNQRFALGTSLCYWRRSWERKPFNDRKTSGEDLEWQGGQVVEAVASVRGGMLDPRMIATIHGHNTASAIDPKAPEWTRAAEWDTFCEETIRNA